MATQQGTDDVAQDSHHEVSVYDLFLALLPFPMLAGVVAGRFTPFPVNTALFIGASLTILVAGWGLFWHYPS